MSRRFAIARSTPSNVTRPDVGVSSPSNKRPSVVFAGAAFANQRYALTLFDCQRHIGERLHRRRASQSTRTEMAGQMFGNHQRGHASSRQRRQRVARFGVASTNGGKRFSHAACRTSQRGAKMQPGGMSCGDGTAPGIPSGNPPPSWGALRNSAIVYGCSGAAKIS